MSQARVLATGLAIGESPRWHDGRLWLANWGTQQIVAVGVDGAAEVVTEVPEATIPFSLDWLPDGRLVVISHTQLLAEEPGGALAPIAELSGVAGGFNEIVVDGHGHVYVNGGDFNPMTGEEFKPGVIALADADGSVRRVADGIAFPNGMAVTPDNATLIIAESYGRRLTAFDIGADGGLSGRRVWADLGDGVPDGICLDAQGAVWYADVPNQRCVRVREGGEVLATVTADRGCFACMLGGDDGRTLFVLAARWGGMDQIDDAARAGQVLTAGAPAPGAGWP
ncbi:MAG TPA: SMP-30/gluconolactonase/LRE family protein [Streptosporangiaceae bacterium]|jgi:sugar lactone lactonase YvrE